MNQTTSNTYYLFRHALATHESSYGDRILTATILPEGRPSIERMAVFIKEQKELASSINFVSPVVRCQETAAIISKVTGKKFVTDERLTEFRGINHEETASDISLLCQSFLNEMENQQTQHVLVCTHGTAMAAFKHIFFNQPYSEEDIHDFPNNGVLWIFHNGSLKSHDFNERHQLLDE